MKLAEERTDLVPPIVSKSLDELLKHFELEPRDQKVAHDAYIDCSKTAQVYMKLKQEPKTQVAAHDDESGESEQDEEH